MYVVCLSIVFLFCILVHLQPSCNNVWSYFPGWAIQYITGFKAKSFLGKAEDGPSRSSTLHHPRLHAVLEAEIAPHSLFRDCQASLFPPETNITVGVFFCDGKKPKIPIMLNSATHTRNPSLQDTATHQWLGTMISLKNLDESESFRINPCRHGL